MELYAAQDHILKKLNSLGAKDIAISASKIDQTQQKFVNNEIIMTKNWVDETIEVFLALGSKGKMQTGLTSVPFTSKSLVDHRLEKLVKFVKLTPVNKNYVAIAKGPFKYQWVPETYDKNLAILKEEDTNLLVEAIGKAMDSGAKRCSGTQEYADGEERVLTSNKVDAVEKGTSIRLSFRALVNKTASAHQVTASRTLKGYDPIGPALEAAKTAHQASKLKVLNLNPKKYDVLFDPLPFANIVNQVGGSASMTDVELETSFLKKGEVADPKFTLYDWGNLPGGLNSSAFDAEGGPTYKTPIIVKGNLEGYLHNTSTANRYKTESTGNAGILNPGPTNLVVEPGKTTDLLATLKNGIYVTNNWYTRFQNYKMGDFSTIPRDAVFVVKGGKMVGVARDVRISDNMLNLLKNIKALGKETRSIVGWEAEIPSVVPAAIIEKVNITKPEN